MTMTTSSPEAFSPLPPAPYHAPIKLADDTYMIRQTQGEGVAPMAVYINSAVILGEQPVIIDTGSEANRERWIEDAFSLVEPEKVRWIFISHDDADHTGNLKQVLAMCPNATLLSSWFLTERLTCAYNLPMERMRWIGDGETFDVGDRKLAAIRPPMYDSPTTRGLYDPKTGFYWGSDCFAAPVTHAVDNINELDSEAWRGGFAMFALACMPWINMVDVVKYNSDVEKLSKLDIKVTASAHTPMIQGADVERAINLLYELPTMPPVQLPGQAELEGMLAGMAGHP
jgi:flavorubredoxin